MDFVQNALGVLTKAADGIDVSTEAAETMGDVGRGLKVLGGALEDAAQEAGPDDDTPNKLTIMEAFGVFTKHVGRHAAGKSSPAPVE